MKISAVRIDMEPRHPTLILTIAEGCRIKVVLTDGDLIRSGSCREVIRRILPTRGLRGLPVHFAEGLLRGVEWETKTVGVRS